MICGIDEQLLAALAADSSTFQAAYFSMLLARAMPDRTMCCTLTGSLVAGDEITFIVVRGRTSKAWACFDELASCGECQ